MISNAWDRREFLKTILAAFPLLDWDWNAFPRGEGVRGGLPPGSYDAIVIGAGLGGLSAAAAFARQGFKVLVLEQHSVPGGYATSFTRPGGFTFDVSLHSTTVDLRDGVPNLIPGFPEIDDITFVPHKPLYRAIYPEHDIRVPHRDAPGYIGLLKKLFPAEAAGIDGLFADMEGLTEEIGRLSRAGGQVDMSTFPTSFPHVFKNFNRTWGAMLDGRVKDAKLKAVISGLWGYFGLPPSKLSAFYYAMPLMGYLEGGGYYPVGTSQKMSDALAVLIRKHEGEIKLNTKVERILTRDHAAIGVRTADGTEHLARAVVSNANAPDTFGRMMPDEKEFLQGHLVRMEKMPLTNLRFTGHPRGAIYGWDQTVDNSGNRRFPQKTPIRNLYLAGAWTAPGHGYGACIPSGLSCFAQVMADWKG